MCQPINLNNAVVPAAISRLNPEGAGIHVLKDVARDELESYVLLWKIQYGPKMDHRVEEGQVRHGDVRL